MRRSFVEVSITTDEQSADPLIGILSQLGFEGFWEDGPTIRCYINKERWVPEMLEEAKRVAALVVRSNASPALRFSVAIVEDQNWNELWERTIQPIQVTERIVISPTWHEVSPSPGRMLLRIDPKMSFGTGYHETTRLCLRLMEKYLEQGATVLDIGTGTGILAIAGVKLGAASAVGVDVDEWSYSNAMENARLNGVEDRVKIVRGELADVAAGKFDFVVANIQLNVIAGLLDDVKAYLHEKSILVLSGLLHTDRQQILETLTQLRFHVIQEITEHEWLALAATNAPATATRNL
jgi:ribosomal protein L11 methyltransferase